MALEDVPPSLRAEMAAALMRASELMARDVRELGPGEAQICAFSHAIVLASLMEQAGGGQITAEHVLLLAREVCR